METLHFNWILRFCKLIHVTKYRRAFRLNRMAVMVKWIKMVFASVQKNIQSWWPHTTLRYPFKICVKFPEFNSQGQFSHAFQMKFITNYRLIAVETWTMQSCIRLKSICISEFPSVQRCPICLWILLSTIQLISSTN